MGRPKPSYEEVRQYFSNRGCILLSNEYTNNKQKLRYICSCGNTEATALFIHFKRKQPGAMCQRCAGNERLSLEFVRQQFIERGCIPLFDSYVNNREKLPYICRCGNPHAQNFYTFQKGFDCPKCKGEKIRATRSHSYEYVSTVFADQGCQLLSADYSSSSQLLDYICSCGRPSKIRFNDFQKGVRCIACRGKTVSKKTSGQNHYRWNTELTAKDREGRRNLREHREWVVRVYKRDNYTCRKCNQRGGRLNAHHLRNFSQNKELRFNVGNGITLCYKCHSSFHRAYGKKDNDEYQMAKFLGIKVGDLANSSTHAYLPVDLLTCL